MEKKKKTKNKKRFTWVNLAQLLTVAALLLWMQWAVDSAGCLRSSWRPRLPSWKRALRSLQTEPYGLTYC